MADNQPEIVPVEQVDRDAAAALQEGWYAVDYEHAMRSGKMDDSLPVQAFARHRLLGRDEGMRRAAEIALAIDSGRGNEREIASAILTKTQRGERG